MHRIGRRAHIGSILNARMAAHAPNFVEEEVSLLWSLCARIWVHHTLHRAQDAWIELSERQIAHTPP